MKYILIDRAQAASTLREILEKVKRTPNKGDFDLENINDFVVSIIQVALGLAGTVALIMVLYSAFLYVTAYGEEGKIETAKKTLYWSIIGLAVIAAAYFITGIVKKYLT